MRLLMVFIWFRYECLLKEIDTTAVEVSVLYSKYVLSFTDQTSAPWNFGGNCPEAAHADYSQDIYLHISKLPNLLLLVSCPFIFNQKLLLSLVIITNFSTNAINYYINVIEH